ncbi:MAG: MipA/OmpV family protein [Rhizobiaceae bacterium]|nr:MipA/OmpV family protein [Rhizobiaceae bacterium]
MPQHSFAQDGEGGGGLFSGNWYLTVGVSLYRAPRYEGSGEYMLSAMPILSLGRAGGQPRFTSRNDNMSLAFFDTGAFRIGAVGKLVFRRDATDSPDLAGLSPVPFGVEAGGFVDLYPADWLRFRTEVRRGFRAHEGVVADFAVDAFADLSEQVQISAGPRAKWASARYFDAYYGVDAAESAASGLSPYAPISGMGSIGFGGALTFKATEKVNVSLFGEYSRLVDQAAASSLVNERGSRNQTLVGVSTTYRFDFGM